MTIAEAKQVLIVDFLARLGHHTQHIKSGQYWYLSPLRNERTPSFKVNDRINEWYDFGEATGGDLVELAKYICRTDCVSEALAYIERLVNGASLPRTRMLTAPPRPVEAEMKDVIVIPLRHHALFSYDRMVEKILLKVTIAGSSHWQTVVADDYTALSVALHEVVGSSFFLVYGNCV